MDDNVKILIVEDEMVIGANISLQLSGLGYEVTGIIPRGEEVLDHIKHDLPDIILMDIQLKGTLDGIQTTKRIQEHYDIPIIYLTANVDDAHFNKAKETNPYAFISKPFKKRDLQRAIELTVNKIQTTSNLQKSNNVPYVLNDSIFVKNHEKMVKILINNVLYVEAERNYCRIYTNAKEYLIVTTLKDLDEKLPQKHFLRIHRSFIVNISHINEIAKTHVVIAKKAIPLSKSLREELLNRLQTI